MCKWGLKGKKGIHVGSSFSSEEVAQVNKACVAIRLGAVLTRVHSGAELPLFAHTSATENMPL